MKESEKEGTGAVWLEDAEVWEYVQEPGRPKFQACPSCGETNGVWYGFQRISRARMVRKRKCEHCGKVYSAAHFESVYGEVDTWEAKWLLRWEPYYDEWIAEQGDTTPS